MKLNKTVLVGLFSAVVASLCCITPVLAVLSGITALTTMFSWITPLRPMFLLLTAVLLGFGWYQKLKPRKESEIHCACDDDAKPSFWQSKKFLGIVTVFAVTMTLFPYYSSIFYESPISLQKESNDSEPQSSYTVIISGMTCKGCETHIKAGLLKVDGVVAAEVNSTTGTAKITIIDEKYNKQAIFSAIRDAGYEPSNIQKK